MSEITSARARTRPEQTGKSINEQVGAGIARLLSGLVTRFGLVAFLLIAWEIALIGSESFHFRPPSAIFKQFYLNWFSGPATSLFMTPAVWNDVVPSVSRALLGWLLGGLIGVLIGVIAGLNANARGYIDPVVSYLRSIPKAALIPTFLIVFGASDLTRVLAIAFSTIWLVLLNTMQGVRSLDPVMRQTAVAFNIPQWRRLTHIVIPAASPKIIAGLRVTLSLALIIMLLSEWVLSSNGIGYYLINSQRNYDITDMWSTVLLIGLIGYILNTAFLMAEKRLLRWHEGAQGRGEAR
ncbi:putative ABC-type nitrate/sulfonate/bicarbonate transport system, permease component (plasmid) [Ensifer adhaerens OV14]|nr:putative ABC-type nitrate/sulfonate/bicarbonate transport system, permease component [Ensifer adhaerens OV14]